MKLTNKDLIGERIGNWTASETPDGCVMWANKNNNVVVIATPHYDKLNEVPIDVFPEFMVLEDWHTLSNTLRLNGKSVEVDKEAYLNEMRTIFSILK